ncbi:hypothetical protein BDM02DRAFT_3267407 [Thelephora ganbajun]|uniref:Uncharacterized protein n=1 Tax=Thelephora ganbajun TaxID=370292 RepID=A0ACB6ZN50_THEGA|nr:hypothetical protein BDM02DRAFT_3267407 [Thelephora ganbajun]
MTLELLPVEVNPTNINDPTSRVIIPQVISAYIAAAGDFHEALPYALLRARRDFMYEANHDPADYNENHGRAIAYRLSDIMSTRFCYLEWDGEKSDLSTALELAIDTRCTIFLSSSEAQNLVLALWNGDIVQKNNKDHDIDYVAYRENRSTSFLDPSRLAVPKYQNYFKIAVWLFFLAVYSIAVREPLDKIDPNNQHIDPWEVILYVLALSFSFDNNFKVDMLSTIPGIRPYVSLMPDLQAAALRNMTFVLILELQLITIFDGYKYMGTLQICVARMLQESGIFFAGLYALDVADGTFDDASMVVHLLIQSLLQSPDYDKFKLSPASLTLYYLWNVVTAVILLNVLISLFSSAYSDLNRYVMFVLFFIPMVCIGFIEVVIDPNRNVWLRDWVHVTIVSGDTADVRDPKLTGGDAERGLVISKIPFTELIKEFPKTTMSPEATILGELGKKTDALNKKINVIEKMDLIIKLLQEKER